MRQRTETLTASRTRVLPVASRLLLPRGPLTWKDCPECGGSGTQQRDYNGSLLLVKCDPRSMLLICIHDAITVAIVAAVIGAYAFVCNGCHL